MTPPRRSPPLARPAFTALSTLLCLVGAWVTARPGRGQDAAGERPAPDLLRAPPFDRVTLTDGTVLVVDPISPRPLPPYDPSKEAKSKRPAAPPPEGNIGLPGEKSRFARAADKVDDRTQEVTLHLLRGEVRDFKVKRAFLRRIEYFEDMLLAEADRLLLAHDFSRAFECCLRVEARQPGWQGLDEHVNRLLYEEGSQALLDGDSARGLRLLSELHARQPRYPGLADRLASSYGARANRAFDLGLYDRGRKVLHELERLAGNHAMVREIRERFIARARQLVQEASQRSGPERLDALTEAVRVWPDLEGAGARFAEAFAAEPTLEVAVDDIPRPVGPWVHSPADERVSRLLYLPILARDDDEAAQGKVAGQLAASLASSDLGRKLVLTLRNGIAWSDGSRPVSSIDVARAFTDRTEPSSPQYNARWAAVLGKVESADESHVEIRLTRGLLKPASWMLGPVGPAHGGWDGRVTSIDLGRQLVGDGPFRWVSSGPNEVRFRASGRAGAASPGALKVRRIHEARLPDARAALGALLRGDISLVEHVPADQVAGLAGHPDLKVGRLARPTLHRIAVDGRNPALRNRTLRRGLSYAIDRRTLLEETLLKHPPDAVNLASDGPFARGSYADAPGVAPLGYDPLLARMLVAAARKELGGEPIKLTLEYPALPEPRAVVPRLVEAFRLVGIEIEAKERPESDLEAELRAGRKFDLAYRASRCEEPVIEAGNLICPGYDAPPAAEALGSVASPRILQLLLQLERAPDWPSARGLALEIDQEGRDELPVLPLWQLQDHYAWRTRLKGPAEVSESLYQGIDSWEIEPWYAKDPW